MSSLIIFLPYTSYAHQDGCHRWHSCPSDSGSYVCGDLGYDDYCPDKELRDPDEPKGMVFLTSKSIFLAFDADDKTLDEGFIADHTINTNSIKKFNLSEDLERARILGKTIDGHTFYLMWDFDRNSNLLSKIWTSNSVLKIIEEHENFEEPENNEKTPVNNEDICLSIVAKLFTNLNPTEEELADFEKELKENNCGDN